MKGPEEPTTLNRALSFFDVTNITVGSIVGADIYIAAAITAGILGPASLVAWLVAAVIATVIAIQSSSKLPGPHGGLGRARSGVVGVTE